MTLYIIIVLALPFLAVAARSITRAARDGNAKLRAGEYLENIWP